MSDTTWELKPLVGIGPLRFGMSLKDVDAFEDLLGQVYAQFDEKKPNGSSVVQQARDLEAPVLYFTKGILTGIQLDHHAKVRIEFGGISVFRDASRDVLAAFEAAEGQAYFGLGATLFPELSISMTGFCVLPSASGLPKFSEDQADAPPKVLNMEIAGAFDPYLAKYEPISFVDD